MALSIRRRRVVPCTHCPDSPLHVYLPRLNCQLTAVPMWYLLASLLIGVLFGRLLRPDPRLRTAVSWVSLASISLLLLSLGAAIGGDEELCKGVGAMGGRAVALAVAAIAGSVLMVVALRRTVLREFGLGTAFHSCEGVEVQASSHEGTLGDSTPGGTAEP